MSIKLHETLNFRAEWYLAALADGMVSVNDCLTNYR